MNYDSKPRRQTFSLNDAFLLIAHGYEKKEEKKKEERNKQLILQIITPLQ